MSDPRWLEWGKRLQTLAQNGLAYNHDPFNIERYTAIRTIATEIMAEYTTTELGRIDDLFGNEIGHATPKVDVRGAVFRDDRILLVKEISDGRWSLPGGWADVYDSPADAIVREIWEESGYRTRVTKLVALLDRTKQGHPPSPWHSYKAFFLCELLGGEAQTSIETAEVGWFSEAGLPELSIDRVTPDQIARLFAHMRDPGLPAEFE